MGTIYIMQSAYYVFKLFGTSVEKIEFIALIFEKKRIGILLIFIKCLYLYKQIRSAKRLNPWLDNPPTKVKLSDTFLAV